MQVLFARAAGGFGKSFLSHLRPFLFLWDYSSDSSRLHPRIKVVNTLFTSRSEEVGYPLLFFTFSLLSSIRWRPTGLLGFSDSDARGRGVSCLGLPIQMLRWAGYSCPGILKVAAKVHSAIIAAAVAVSATASTYSPYFTVKLTTHIKTAKISSSINTAESSTSVTAMTHSKSTITPGRQSASCSPHAGQVGPGPVSYAQSGGSGGFGIGGGGTNSGSNGSG